MDTVYFQELKHYSKSNILHQMGNDEKAFDKLLKHTIINKDEDSYQFKYVGIIIIDNLVINCYPKYIPNIDNIESDFKQVLKVIKKYNKSYELDYQNDNLEDISFNLLSMMVFFLEDYYEYGIYSNIQNILEINGNGEIDWNRTVNYTNPIIKDNKPYYTELHTKYKINDLFDYFRLLHEYIITECSRRLKESGLLDLFDLTPVELSDKKLDDFGETDFILEKLQKELNMEFNSHKQKLLKSMYTFLREENSFSNKNYLTLFGTNTYHVIWEEMCKKIFKDNLNKELNTLKLPSKLNEKYNHRTRLIDIIEKPKWVLRENNKMKEADGTLIPDIISFYKDTFVILDAKYYKLKFNEIQLNGHPGIGSITKQYLYQLAYKEFIKLHKFKTVKNAFLFPTYDDEITNKGYVELNILNDCNLENIQVIMLPANKINQYYLENRHLSLSELKLE